MIKPAKCLRISQNSADAYHIVQVFILILSFFRRQLSIVKPLQFLFVHADQLQKL